MLTHIIRDTTLKILNALPHHSILILAAKWCRTPMRVYPLNPVSANNPCCLLLYAHLGYFLKCYNSIWGRMKKKNSLFSFLITVSADNSEKKPTSLNDRVIVRLSHCLSWQTDESTHLQWAYISTLHTFINHVSVF